MPSFLLMLHDLNATSNPKQPGAVVLKSMEPFLLEDVLTGMENAWVKSKQQLETRKSEGPSPSPSLGNQTGQTETHYSLSNQPSS